MALGSRGMMVEATRNMEGVESPGEYVDDLVSRRHICLAPVFRTALPHSGGLSHGERCDVVVVVLPMGQCLRQLHIRNYK